MIPLTISVVRQVGSLTITKAPTQTLYIRGEAPVIRGLVLEAAYADGSRETITGGWNSTTGTGMKVRLLDGSTVKAKVTVVVTGDTNGEKAVSITDFIQIKAHGQG